MPVSPFVGQIAVFANSYAPPGWLECNGQSLPINQNQTLFAVIGTTYGGNGSTTFSLPDLRGRISMHAGDGDRLTPRVLGQSVGRSSVRLTADDLPEHTHGLRTAPEATAATPGQPLAVDTRVVEAADTTPTVRPAGASLPVDITPPSLVMMYYIAVEGAFPST